MNVLIPAESMNVIQQARYIDHSVLKPQFTEEEVLKHVKMGVAYGCKTVCINPSNLSIARSVCEGTNTGICVTCDFPFGASSTKSKVAQAELAIKDGCVEDLDVVSNFGLIRSGKWDAFKDDIQAVVDIAHKYSVLTKVILETDALTLQEIVRATEIAVHTGVDFIKTSTGFYTGGIVHGATVEIIKTMIETVDGKCRIKGSGCIRTREHFLSLINLGIDRMGVGYQSTPIVLGL